LLLKKALHHWGAFFIASKPADLSGGFQSPFRAGESVAEGTVIAFVVHMFDM
jgi:hypothetical protein